MEPRAMIDPAAERRLVQDPRCQLAAVVAHQLRNRLSRLVFGVEAFTHSDSVDPTLLRAAGRVRRGVDELVVWFDRLAELVRVMAGTATLRVERIDLGSLIGAELERSAASFQARQQAVHVDLPDEPLWVDGDALGLQVLFSNLISNAAKFSDAGGAISVALCVRGHDVDVAVIDQGLGLSRGRLQTVFEPFSDDVSEAGAQGGIGAGLYLARTIARLHHGEIVAHSDGPHRGCRFTVTLPIARSTTHPHVTEGIPRALVVHGQPGPRGLLSATLRSWGYHVRDVAAPTEAVSAAREHTPSVVLIGEGLSASSGHLLPLWLRELTHSAGTRFVLVGGEEGMDGPIVAGYDCRITGTDPDLLHALLRGS